MEYEPKKLNGYGQCCGRRPIAYKRPPHLFCPRCDAAYDIDTGFQIENWAFVRGKRGFIPKGISTMTVAELIDEGKLTPLSSA